jgi:Flp pilus assembly protein TadD
VHLTFEGRVAVAALMVDGLAELLEVESNGKADAQSWWEDFPRKVEAARERTLFTEFDEASMLGEAAALMEMEAFSGMPDVSERRERLAGRAAELERRSLGEFDAVKMWRRHGVAAEANPEDPWVDKIASRIFMDAGRLDEALQLARSAHGKAPNLGYARLGLCLDALRANRLEEAKGHLEAVERYRVKDDLVPGLRGEVLFKSGDFAGAVPHLQRHALRNPGDSLVWCNLAMAQEKSGRPRDAIASYRQGLAANPRDGAILNNLAWLLATLGDGTAREREEAVEIANRAVAVVPESHRFRGTLAVALMESGRETEGREEAEQAMEMARKAGDEEAVETLERFMTKTDD